MVVGACQELICATMDQWKILLGSQNCAPSSTTCNAQPHRITLIITVVYIAKPEDFYTKAPNPNK